MRRGATGLLLAAAVLLTLVLRAELMTRHPPLPAGSVTDVTVSARVKARGAPVGDLAQGLVDACRLVVNPGSRATPLRQVGPALYAFRLAPGLDEYDLRELRGCLQDLREERVLLDVRVLRTVRAS